MGLSIFHIPEPNPLQERHHPTSSFRGRNASKKKSELGVFVSREDRNKVVGLEDESHVGQAEICRLPLLEASDVLVRYLDPAGSGVVQDSDDVQEGGFSRARGAGQGRELPFLYVQIHSPESQDFQQSLLVYPRNLPEADKGAVLPGGRGGEGCRSLS